MRFLHRRSFFLFSKRCCPRPQFRAQLFKLHASVAGRELLELLQSLCQQRFRSLPVVARKMMERCGYLRDALQKSFVWLRRFEPNGLPSLVRVEEFFRVELFHSLPERFQARRVLTSFLQFAPSA